MNIKKISVNNDGYIHCKSSFYSSQDILNNAKFDFDVGINKLTGEIDSGIWAISYLLSMYKHRPRDFVLFERPIVAVNDKWISLNELSEFSCYMDKLDPLFSSNRSVKKLIIQGLRHSKLNCSYDDIKNLFYIDSERFERPLNGVGNEIFKAMAAIGFSYKKEIFCFLWLSNRRFESYHENLTTVLQILEKLEKTVIIPVGISPQKT
ncbi:MAG: hypothetical protein PUF48_04395 [Oscillospiraceae bacterium]|nr:hypothetical protein [Oscillospiraceae bacterium]